MYHMMKASVRDLRYNFPQIEARLRAGEEIEITKRKQVIARLSPVRTRRKKKMPDFAKMLKEIYGDKVFEVSGAELISADREERF